MSLSEQQLKQAKTQAEGKAGYLVQRPSFSREEYPDITQSLLLKLQQVYPKYNPDKLVFHTFVDIVYRNHIGTLIRVRNNRIQTISLDSSPSDAEGEDEYPAIPKAACKVSNTILKIALDQAWNKLPKGLKLLMLFLMVLTPTELARRCYMTLFELKKYIGSLRDILAAMDLNSASFRDNSEQT